MTFEGSIARWILVPALFWGFGTSAAASDVSLDRQFKEAKEQEEGKFNDIDSHMRVPPQIVIHLNTSCDPHVRGAENFYSEASTSFYESRSSYKDKWGEINDHLYKKHEAAKSALPMAAPAGASGDLRARAQLSEDQFTQAQAFNLESGEHHIQAEGHFRSEASKMDSTRIHLESSEKSLQEYRKCLEQHVQRETQRIQMAIQNSEDARNAQIDNGLGSGSVPLMLMAAVGGLMDDPDAEPLRFDLEQIERRAQNTLDTLWPYERHVQTLLTLVTGYQGSQGAAEVAYACRCGSGGGWGRDGRGEAQQRQRQRPKSVSRLGSQYKERFRKI